MNLAPRSPEESVAARKQGSARGLASVLQSLTAKFLIVAINTATGVLTARVLHPTGRGELAAILLWPQVLASAVSLGLPSAMIYNLRSQPKRASQMLMAGLTLALMIGSTTAVIAMLLAPELLHKYRPEVIQIGRWIMPNVVAGMYLLIGRSALEARSKFLQSGFVLTTPPLLTLVGLCLLAITHRLSPENAAAAYILSGIPALALLLRQLPVSLHHSPGEIVACMRSLLSYGVRSYGIDLCGTLAFYMDQALVVTLLSPRQMGAYVVALSLSRVMNVGQQAVTAVLFPKMVGLANSEVARLTQRTLRVTSTISVVSVIAIALCGTSVLRLVYGPAYAGGGTLLLLLVLEAGISGCVSIAAQPFMASNRPGVITMQQAIGLICAVPLMLMLIPRMGVNGAAMALLISTAIRFCFVSVSFKRHFGGRLPRLLLNRDSAMWAWERLRPFRPRNDRSTASPCSGRPIPSEARL